jgi:catechol 2,3-dioxygenase-like lactoylglutathione lyase family enzyme
MNHVESISAITLVTADMAASVAFYGVLGSEVVFGGVEASFTTLKLNDGSTTSIRSTTRSLRPASRR